MAFMRIWNNCYFLNVVMLISSKVVNKKFYNVEFEEKVLSIGRVVKVVKGGRIFSFSVLVVIGNKSGCFGVGLGKALEINDARKKAVNNAKNNLYQVILTKDKTIPHVVTAKFGSTRVIVRPAKIGRGIIAGGAMRVILECLGVSDVVAKCIGSSNSYNLSYATINALLKLKSSKYYSKLKNLDKKIDFNISDINDESETIDSTVETGEDRKVSEVDLIKKKSK